mgnify:CR=1 FL=1
MNRAIPAAIITAVGLGALASFQSTTGLPVKSAGAVTVPSTTVPDWLTQMGAEERGNAAVSLTHWLVSV